jgi:D-3-phosphoglycerate dehydrogenase
MNVIVHDPLVSDEVVNELDLKSVDLENIWKNSDVISVHVPLNDRTKNLISYDELAKCKTGVAIINCARGGIVNEKALLKSLKEGKVSGAGLDVFESEPPDFNLGLIQHPAVVSTPHLGASTEEAQQKVAVQIAEQVVEYFTSGTATGAVNATSIKEITLDNLKAYIRLAEVLGKILSQIRNGSLKKLVVNYYGELIPDHTRILSTAFLKGFLSEEMEEPVNYINANILAEEMGIILEEVVSTDVREYYNLIETRIITDIKEWKFKGTVFGNSELRIVNVNNFPVEFKPEGNILIYSNIDKPGMLTSVSKVLSNSNINIAALSLGRLTEGDYALTVINLDNSVVDELKKTISSIEGIKDIYSVCI